MISVFAAAEDSIASNVAAEDSEDLIALYAAAEDSVALYAAAEDSTAVFESFLALPSVDHLHLLEDEPVLAHFDAVERALASI